MHFISLLAFTVEVISMSVGATPALVVSAIAFKAI